MPTEPSMHNETTTTGLCTDTLVGTLSVYCVTCRGPNILSAVQDLVFTAAQQYISSAQLYLHQPACSLPTAERPRASIRVAALISIQPLTGCIHYSATFITVVVAYIRLFILVISRIVRIPALLGILRTPIVRVCALVRRLFI